MLLKEELHILRSKKKKKTKEQGQVISTFSPIYLTLPVTSTLPFAVFLGKEFSSIDKTFEFEIVPERNSSNFCGVSY